MEMDFLEDPLASLYEGDLTDDPVDFTATDFQVDVGPESIRSIPNRIYFKDQDNSKIIKCSVPQCRVTTSTKKNATTEKPMLFPFYENGNVNSKLVSVMRKTLKNPEWSPSTLDMICFPHLQLQGQPNKRRRKETTVVLASSQGKIIERKEIHSSVGCLIPNCSSKRVRKLIDGSYHQRVPLHSFPHSNTSDSGWQRQQWIDVMRKLFNDDGWNPLPKDKLCSLHFEDKDKNYPVLEDAVVFGNGGRILRNGVPKLNLGVDYEELMGRKSRIPTPPITIANGLEDSIGLSELTNSNSISIRNVCKILTNLCKEKFPEDFKTDHPAPSQKEMELGKKLFISMERQIQSQDTSEAEEWHNIETFIDESYEEEQFQVQHHPDIHIDELELEISSIGSFPTSSFSPSSELPNIPKLKRSSFVAQILEAIQLNSRKKPDKSPASTKTNAILEEDSSNSNNFPLPADIENDDDLIR